MPLEFCDIKHLCIANTWFENSDKKMITYGSGCNESEIDLCIMAKGDCKFFFYVKVITGELQHNPVIALVDMMKIKKIKLKPEGQKQNISKLRDERQLF